MQILLREPCALGWRGACPVAAQRSLRVICWVGELTGPLLEWRDHCVQKLAAGKGKVVVSAEGPMHSCLYAHTVVTHIGSQESTAGAMSSWGPYTGAA